MDDPDVKAREMETTLAEHRRLKEENAALRQLLADNRIPIPSPVKNGPQPAIEREGQHAGVNKHSGKDAKVMLFRDLFRGREDVYAVRKQFKSGEWVYVPASIRDLTDDVLRQHLEGKHTVGVYPQLLYETCWFLAVDFERKSWKEDVAAFLETCREVGVPAVLERSRSGD